VHPYNKDQVYVYDQFDGHIFCTTLGQKISNDFNFWYGAQIVKNKLLEVR